MYCKILDEYKKKCKDQLILTKLKWCGSNCMGLLCLDGPFSYSAKEPGSSVIFIHFDTRGSIEWR